MTLQTLASRLARRLPGPQRPAQPDGIQIRGEWTVERYRVADLRARWSDWDDCSDYQRLVRLRDVEPDHASTSTNTVTFGLTETLVDFLDPGQTATDLDVSHIVVGDDDTEPAASNGTLNNQILQKGTGTVTDNGSQIETSTILNTNEANGETIREAGLYHDGSSTLLNHSLVGPERKNDTFELTLSATIFFVPSN